MMKKRNFRELLENQWSNGLLICAGLDSDSDQIPNDFQRTEPTGEFIKNTLLRFNVDRINKTFDLVCGYKINTAFYERHGAQGVAALQETIVTIKRIAPEKVIILDAKRADIGNTNIGYAKFAFDHLGADAITVHPYLGKEAMQPFLERKDKGIFVLCRTSNPGAGEFQDLLVNKKMRTSRDSDSGFPQEHLYEIVARNVARIWDDNKNCALVVGATYPDELLKVRQIVGDMPILIPGIGAQGGDLEATLKAGADSRGRGMIINNSRGIIFSPDPREAALEMDQKIRQIRNS